MSGDGVASVVKESDGVAQDAKMGDAPSPSTNPGGGASFLYGVKGLLNYLGTNAGVKDTTRAILSNDIIKTALIGLSTANKGDVQQIAASQVALMLRYHEMALAQSRRSFNWALIGAGVGMLFFMTAAGLAIHDTRNTAAVVVPVISGAVVEVVSGIVFFLYGKTSVQLSDFHSRLEALQRYLLANSICEALHGEEQNKARAELIREIAKVNRSA
jgi:hypothetical protein